MDFTHRQMLAHRPLVWNFCMFSHGFPLKNGEDTPDLSPVLWVFSSCSHKVTTKSHEIHWNSCRKSNFKHHELPIRNHTMKSPFLFGIPYQIMGGTINWCRISQPQNHNFVIGKTHLAVPRPSAAPPSPAAAAAVWRFPRTPRPAEARRKWRRAPATPKMSRCSRKYGKKLGFNHPKNGKSSKNGEKIENHPKIMKTCVLACDLTGLNQQTCF